MAEVKQRYDALVIGGGIAGMQAALDLGEQRYDVLLVEREPSIGGVMVGLNKVFPTLDCSSCICTPRMAESAHHRGIQIQTYTEVLDVTPHGSGYKARLRKKPRYVDEVACIGCSKCEFECPVMVPHEFDCGVGARRAIYIPHANAIPQVAVLDADHCTFCGKCAKVCPAHCINYAQEAEDVEIEIGAVIIASGLKVAPMDMKKEFGGGRFSNVMSPLAMERIQSSNGPYGRVLRPSDGKIPENIAYIHCASSRDLSLGIPYCSRVCCMYSIKQALLLRHYIHDVNVTLYYMDIRAFGKGYEQFYRRAMNEGVQLVRGKVAKISETDDNDLVLRVEHTLDGGIVQEHRHDLVVLSQGLMAGWHPEQAVGVDIASDGFVAIAEEKLNPAFTTLPGVFAAGVAAGPKDIPDAIVEAGEAAMAAAVHLQDIGWMQHKTAAVSAQK